MNSKHIQHLYWRAGFGILPSEQYYLANLAKDEVVEQLFESSKIINPLSIDLSEFNEFDRNQFIKDKTIRKKFRELSREKIKTLNHAWIMKLVNSKQMLRDRMVLFWANHFVCDDKNIFYALQFNNTLREHALGDFRSFVKAISKEAAMIRYLNLNQNNKSKPNENFARELMELFTLGEGHYSEKDIKESARAFTGYRHNFKGDFVFSARIHDYGDKTLFGRNGEFDGDDIIDIILEQKQCARFICEKIYSYFVNEVIVRQHINQMVDVFYPNYDIEQLMRFVFTSSWFYRKENIGNKIKSPIEYLVGMYKTVPFEFEKEKELLYLQHILGQKLLFPPNVAGWEGGKSWIDVNTIMLRMRLPSVLLNQAMIPAKEKGDFNDSFRNYYLKKNKEKLPFKTKVDWDSFYKNYKSFSSSTLKLNLINCEMNDGTRQFLETLNSSNMQDYCIQLMSLPEYQLC